MIYRAFPKIDMTEKSAIRYTSGFNEWIDFVIIVDNQYKDLVQQAINTAIDEFWNSDDECYGDCIEYYLNEASIPRMTFYYDPYGDIDEYDRTWEAFINDICVIEKEL